ncbi:MAG: DsbA family protein [Gemmatimonadota bacterium]
MAIRSHLTKIAVLASAVAAPASAQDAGLKDVGYDRGNPNAAVTVVEFGDFGCTACGHFARESFQRVEDEFIKSGIVFWKYVPFVAGLPNGAAAARAAECAAEQGTFWAMHDRLYADQSRWLRERDPKGAFASYAREIGVDVAQYESCYRENRGKARTRRNNSVARELRVRATPTFFINGRAVQGVLPFETFRTLLHNAAGH